MAKRKTKLNLNIKILLIIVLFILFIGTVIFAFLYPEYTADKNLKKVTLQNSDISNKYDYSGTTVEDTGTTNKVSYSHLGTGFTYEFPVNTNMVIDSSNSEDLPNLRYEDIMPYSDSAISFGYADPEAKIPGPDYRDHSSVNTVSVLSRRQVFVDGNSAEIIEAEESYPGYGSEIDNSTYAYHIYVVVDDVNQGVRYSSKRVELEPKKFIIHGSTGNTKDERAKAEIFRTVNEIISTIKFIEN